MTLIATLLLLAGLVQSPAPADWSDDPVWHDGLVEKATYDATRVIYGKPRRYEAVVFTNKERYDTDIETKAAPESDDVIEVWKFNIVEVVPTPNYDYKFLTTAHLTTDGLSLRRLDAASQEYCGASFKQIVRGAGGWDGTGFSYLPGQGNQTTRVPDADGPPVIAEDALGLYLRDYDFAARPTLELSLIPSQSSNALEPQEPVAATVTHAGETTEGHRLTVSLADGTPVGTYTFAKNRLRVLLAYDGADGRTLRLENLDRVNYWTRDE